MIDNIKANLFTIHGLLTSLIHGLLLVGAVCSWILFQVQVMGNDVSMSMPSTTAMKTKLGR